MARIARVLLVGVVAGALAAPGAVPAVAQHESVTLACNSGFAVTADAHAAAGLGSAAAAFTAHNPLGVTCEVRQP